jgi:hypothetical protein
LKTKKLEIYCSQRQNEHIYGDTLQFPHGSFHEKGGKSPENNLATFRQYHCCQSQHFIAGLDGPNKKAHRTRRLTGLLLMKF